MSSRFGNFIITHSGKYVYMLDPYIEDIDINDIAHSLSHICRWSGHVDEFYPVACHSLMTSLIVSKEHPELALAALHHDDAEAYTSDINAPLKHFLYVKIHEEFIPFSEVEDRLLRVIYTALGITYPTAEEWKIVKAADRAVLKIEAEYLMPKFKVPWAGDSITLEMTRFEWDSSLNIFKGWDNGGYSNEDRRRTSLLCNEVRQDFLNRHEVLKLDPKTF